jgi:Fe-S oxidoreductase
VFFGVKVRIMRPDSKLPDDIKIKTAEVEKPKEKAKVLYFVGCVASFSRSFKRFLKLLFKSWTRVKWTSPPLEEKSGAVGFLSSRWGCQIRCKNL